MTTTVLIVSTAYGLMMLQSGMLKKQLAWRRRRRNR